MQTCECECPFTIRCASGQTFNTRTCQCESNCGNVQCSFPRRLNFATCRCECSSTLVCTRPQVFSQTNCRCECPSVDTCSLPQQFDFQSCQCRCPGSISCSVGFSFNPTTCQCVRLDLPTSAPAMAEPCPLTQSNCNSRQIFNSRACRCDCFAYSVVIPGRPAAMAPAAAPRPFGFGGGLGFGLLDYTGTRSTGSHSSSRRSKREADEVDMTAQFMRIDDDDDDKAEEINTREKRQFFFGTRGTKSRCTPKQRRRGRCYGVALPLPQPLLQPAARPVSPGFAGQASIPSTTTLVLQCPTGTRTNSFECRCV